MDFGFFRGFFMEAVEKLEDKFLAHDRSWRWGKIEECSFPYSKPSGFAGAPAEKKSCDLAGRLARFPLPK
jgi:hypothetical protein